MSSEIKPGRDILYKCFCGSHIFLTFSGWLPNGTMLCLLDGYVIYIIMKMAELMKSLN